MTTSDRRHPVADPNPNIQTPPFTESVLRSGHWVNPTHPAREAQRPSPPPLDHRTDHSVQGHRVWSRSSLNPRKDGGHCGAAKTNLALLNGERTAAAVAWVSTGAAVTSVFMARLTVFTDPSHPRRATDENRAASITAGFEEPAVCRANFGDSKAPGENTVPLSGRAAASQNY